MKLTSMKEKILNKLSDIGDKLISLSTNTNTVIFNYSNCYLGSNTNSHL